jgi:hypothetical protein
MLLVNQTVDFRPFFLQQPHHQEHLHRPSAETMMEAVCYAFPTAAILRQLKGNPFREYLR